MIIARLLGPVGRGEVGAINLWPTVMCGLLTLGVPVALRYEIRRAKLEERSEIFSVSIVLGALLGVAACAIGVLLLPRWLVHYSPNLIRFAQLMMLFAPQVMLQLIVQAFLEARGDFVQANRIVYLPQLTTLLALIVLHFLGRLVPVTAALSYATPSLMLTVSSLYRLRKSLRFPRNFALWTKQLLNYGIRAYGLDILATISSQIDQALVIGLLSATSFGLYVVAINISRSLMIFAVSLNTVLFPRAASLTSADAIALVTRGARVIFATTVVAGILFASLLPAAITIAYGKEYLEDIALSRILIAEAAITTTVSTLAQAFMATGRPGLVTVLQACGIATTLPLMLVFIPRFGLTGAAYALLTSTMLRLVLVLISYPLFLREKIPRLVLTRQDLKSVYAKIKQAA